MKQQNKIMTRQRENKTARDIGAKVSVYLLFKII